jgi:hypothetical protein
MICSSLAPMMASTSAASMPVRSFPARQKNSSGRPAAADAAIRRSDAASCRRAVSRMIS